MSSFRAKVVFATCSRERMAALVETMRHTGEDLPLYVVSEFAPPQGQWIPYHPLRSAADNRARIARQLGELDIRLAGLYLDPQVPYWPLRWLALQLTSWRAWVFFSSDLNHFMLRPGSLPAIARFLWWRTRETVRFELNPGGRVYTFFWRLAHPSHFRRPWLVWRALHLGTDWKHSPDAPVTFGESLPAGLTVVIPSRNGADLLARLLPLVEADQVIVVDNGSDVPYSAPGVECMVEASPLSFAAAVNRGIAAARYSHVCLLNNDMVIEPGFFAALREAFDRVPDLFCATAQIFFPEGMRRQETGKAAMLADPGPADFPLTCLEPLPGEDLTWVLYGSGGCSLYCTAKLRALGGLDESYRPAYVEDLDLGYRAWLAGWPTVYVRDARVVHHHRSTTSRYFDESALRHMVELNYLRFLARALHSPEVFSRLWQRAITRLNLLAAGHEPDPVPLAVLAEAKHLEGRAPHAVLRDERILALGSGDVACFPGQVPADGIRVLIATCYPPYPLAHGGAVRMYNLMRRAAAQGVSQVLVVFGDELTAPAPELLAICHRVVMVRRRGSHYRVDSGRPDVVDEFDSPVMHAVLARLMLEFLPHVVQLEFTQMAVYLETVSQARTLLVEHDITLDLYQQLLARNPSEELREQLSRWQRFETAAWQKADQVIVMSERDRLTAGPRAVVLPNGVDLDRYQPGAGPVTPNHLLFIGSFNHLPNLLALDWFLREVWPLLTTPATLQIIAGARHEYYLDFYRASVAVNLAVDRVEVQGFVSDVRPAYQQAALVIAPLRASAGTNIKILEAMAMGKAIVTTAAGINGLEDLAGYTQADTASNFAAAIDHLLANPDKRKSLEQIARHSVEQNYSWDTIAATQQDLYKLGKTAGAPLS
ncbi:MAG: glycosyltransferase [Bryobacteraceae bacterium]|nr:glycosyltransferase [Bryobacteraceae bacterium]